MSAPLTFGSLFAGIGGIDLGLERAGMTCAWQVEIDDYATRVLEKHWPHVPKFRDIRDCGAHNLPTVDLLAGGFPCQDISNAGQRSGIDGERSGLWSEYARIVREIRPRYVLVENVAALLFRGLGRVLGDLAALGYDAEWECLPAAAFGAPHRRDRLFIVAHANSIRPQAHTDEAGLCAAPILDGYARHLGNVGGARQWIGARPIGARPMGVGDGLSARMDKDRIKGCGNAVVPQVAEFIGRCIVEAQP